MDGFKQIKSFYCWVFNNPDKARPTHISLYLFLWNQNNRSNWVEWFKCPYDLAMQGACIGSKSTYYKCLDQLSDWKLIEYKKGLNNYKAPQVKLIRLYKNEPLSGQVSIPLSGQPSEPLTEQVNEPLSVLLTGNIYKLLTDNYKLVNDNLEHWLSIVKDSEDSLSTKHILLCSISDESELNTLEDQISFAFWKLFKKHKADMGINSTVNLDKAKLKDWSNHVDKTIRLDKRTHEEFKEVWKFLNTNEWWKGKVQSMDKLRKQFEQLLENARKETNKKTDGFKQNTSRSATRTHMQRQDYD